MSESESNSIVESFSGGGIDDAFQDDDSQMESYVNDRREHYEESYGYRDRDRKSNTDPASKNKRYVRRLNPFTNKYTTVEFFPTPTMPNRPIKNALTGINESFENRIFRVGTKDEDLFFSVILATGELGDNFGTTLFYQHPDHYERHFFTKLPTKLKADWEIKRAAAMNRMNVTRSTLETGVSVRA